MRLCHDQNLRAGSVLWQRKVFVWFQWVSLLLCRRLFVTCFGHPVLCVNETVRHRKEERLEIIRFWASAIFIASAKEWHSKSWRSIGVFRCQAKMVKRNRSISSLVVTSGSYWILAMDVTVTNAFLLGRAYRVEYYRVGVKKPALSLTVINSLRQIATKTADLKTLTTCRLWFYFVSRKLGHSCQSILKWSLFFSLWWRVYLNSLWDLLQC